jgi:hypothetical protein
MTDLADRLAVDCLTHVCPKAMMREFAASAPRQVLNVIQTRYVPPTDTEGSRYAAVSLTHGTYVATVAADYSLCSDENALAAALQLLIDATISRWVLISRAGTDDGWIFCFEALDYVF